MAAVAALCFSVGTAEAQYDHLKCYKVKDQKTFKKASATLTAIQSQFLTEDCDIKPKAKEFCTPVDKTVTILSGGSPQVLDGNELSFHRLCYKIKCPKTDLGTHDLSDQFGEHTATEKYKASTICVPAIDGPVVP